MARPKKDKKCNSCGDYFMRQGARAYCNICREMRKTRRLKKCY